MTVIFRTKGSLDLRAITTFGINSKPHTVSPIGYFGTGLKYAIAVLMRENHSVSIYVGRTRFSFIKVKDNFRDKEFDFIEMQSSAIFGTVTKRVRLPFTTELGKNWKMWQAFRELYSNTIDEEGETFVAGPDAKWQQEEGLTHIVVDGVDFENEYYDRDKHFLPEGLRQRVGDAVQIVDRPSNHVYYRGLRVMDLQKPSAVTYNILASLELTEDRTVKHPYYVDVYVKSAIAKSADASIIDKVLSVPKEKYEHGFDFSDHHEAPSQTFEYVVRKMREEKRALNFSAWSYTNKWDAGAIRAEKARPYLLRMAEAVEKGDWSKMTDIASENADEFYRFLMASTPLENHEEAA